MSIDGRPSAAGARFVLVTHDDGAIQIGITETWSVIDGRPWLGGDDVISASIWVAPDRRSLTTPGTGQA